MKFIILNSILFFATLFVTINFRPTEAKKIKLKKTCNEESLLENIEEPSSILLSNVSVKIGDIPCTNKETSKLLASFGPYSKEILNEVSRLAETIEEELSKDPDSKDWKAEEKRSKKMDISTDFFAEYYPRFQLQKGKRTDYLYYGIHTGPYKDVMRFLGERTCSSPQLTLANSDISYLGLFFSINNAREYGGIIRIINEKNITPIEGSMRFYGIDDYFKSKRKPAVNFRSWVHEERETDRKAFVYQDQEIDEPSIFQDKLFISPWLYNSCNKSIATIHNNCSLDSSYDMELKEIFYLTDFDLMLGNIYCKKSNDQNWHRIATMEFIQI